MDVALLAPVPAILMRSAIDICATKGTVAFGTNAFEVFAKLDEQYGEGVPVLIYPTGQHGDPDGVCSPGSASFRAVYRRTQQAWRGKHPAPELRPATTIGGDQQDTNWALFWEITSLVHLSKADRIPITKLTAEGKKKTLPFGFVLHGPTLVTAHFL